MATIRQLQAQVNALRRQSDALDARARRKDEKANEILGDIALRLAKTFYGLKLGDVLEIKETTGRTYRIKIESFGVHDANDTAPRIHGIELNKKGVALFRGSLGMNVYKSIYRFNPETMHKVKV